MRELFLGLIVAVTIPFLVQFIINKINDNKMNRKKNKKENKMENRKHIVTMTSASNTNIEKGEEGEKLVAEKLELLNDEYVVFNDLLFEHDGHTAQIDHIVLCRAGCFVIETKNHLGVIEKDKHNFSRWHQTLHGKDSVFYSPTMQNYEHMKMLQDISGMPKRYMQSIIVFPNETTLAVNDKYAKIIHMKDICRVIEKYDYHFLEEWRVKSFADRIKKANIQSAHNMKIHTESVKKKYF